MILCTYMEICLYECVNVCVCARMCLCVSTPLITPLYVHMFFNLDSG